MCWTPQTDFGFHAIYYDLHWIEVVFGLGHIYAMMYCRAFFDARAMHDAKKHR